MDRPNHGASAVGWTVTVPEDWTPTRDNTAALPPPVAAYIKELEAKVAELERRAQSRLWARLR